MRLSYENTAETVASHAHGRHRKTLVVLHETVSPDLDGWKDIDGVERYLAQIGYGIHGMTDAEGHVAWAYGFGSAVFWQAGGVNEQSIGIEQVSNVMLRSPSNPARRKIWTARKAQLRATARLLACISRAHGIPLRYVEGDGKHSGVTSHWSVARHFSASEGHTDCWPVNDGGYYPTSEVLTLARGYLKAGLRF